MDFQGSALDLADLIMDCENADAKHHYKFHRNEEGPFTCIGHILDALKEAHSLGVKQGRGEQREVDLKIVRSWKAFYKSMQDKSKLGEKDGLYRFFAAEDIEKEILSATVGEEK